MLRVNTISELGIVIVLYQLLYLRRQKKTPKKNVENVGCVIFACPPGRLGGTDLPDICA